MWQSLAPWLAQGGVIGTLAWFGYRLHSDAVAAERRRADDHRAAAQADRARADLLESRWLKLLGHGVRDDTSEPVG